MAEEKQSKFASEVIDLPSKGKVYPKDSPLSSGKLGIKYMTAKEEDILTSQNLIKKGVVIDKLIDSLIVDKGVKCDDLILGDKNAVMVAARILAYGSKYEVELTNQFTDEKFKHIFDLTDCPFKEISDNVDYSTNSFELELPVSKAKVIFKLLTGSEEKIISKELKRLQKISSVSPEITTRLKHSIISINGDEERTSINGFVDNMLSRDSLFLRQEIRRIAPDIDLKQEVEMEGELVEVDIPLTANFFWPNTAT